MDKIDLRRGVPVPSLRAWREYRLLAQGELAKRAHIHRDTVVVAEQGRPIRLTTVGKLAKALGIDRQALVYQFPPSPEGAQPHV